MVHVNKKYFHEIKFLSYKYAKNLKKNPLFFLSDNAWGTAHSSCECLWLPIVFFKITVIV